MTRHRVTGLLAAVLAGLLASVAHPSVAAAAPGPGSAPEYWFDTWQVPALWSAGARGQGVTIAEIDTGVAVVPELRGKVLPGTDLSTAGGNGQSDRDVDTFGHGTAMASIMVARPGTFDVTGLAPDARVLPIAVPLDGTAEAGQPDQLAAAIRYAADHGAKIINMSLGGKRTQAVDSTACPDDEQQAIYHALAKGAVLTAAAGNGAQSGNPVEDPAACLGVIAVGAADSAGHPAAFSARQPYVTLLAPGVGIASLSRVAGTAYSGDGTSQATALTSAALALVWSKYPTLTGPQVVARVLATLSGRTATPSTSSGYGVLDAGRAVRADVPLTAPDPVSDAVAPFLARFQALGADITPPPRAPAKAATGRLPGGYAVGSVPALSSQVLLGSCLAAAGIVVLLAAGGVELCRRRVAVPPAATAATLESPQPAVESTQPAVDPPPPVDSAQPAAERAQPVAERAQPVVGPALPAVDPGGAPRPRPRPGPGDGTPRVTPSTEQSTEQSTKQRGPSPSDPGDRPASDAVGSAATDHPG